MARVSDVRTMWAAAGGQAPPRELIEARAGLSRGERRAAARAVRRGETADDPALARLAVAMARAAIRRHPSRPLVGFFALLVVGWAGFAITGFAAGHFVVGALLSATFLFGLWVLNRMRPRYAEAARSAERLNREALERAGQPFREDPDAAEPVRPSAPAVTVAALTLWVLRPVLRRVERRDRRPLAGRGARGRARRGVCDVHDDRQLDHHPPPATASVCPI